ncbi:hypothetical protein CC80DRAFT_499900 [Byssothecium circinans]|uniref:Uncharacterized protein n=1 Tax=Byssothecium circinans TaxID=147558 RepID=A0A6A5UC75_9PLEO|nr:hypothetical protein CC80DRAFT_499900 [Byssothecium circinans]
MSTQEQPATSKLPANSVPTQDQAATSETSTATVSNVVTAATKLSPETEVIRIEKLLRTHKTTQEENFETLKALYGDIQAPDLETGLFDPIYVASIKECEAKLAEALQLEKDFDEARRAMKSGDPLDEKYLSGLCEGMDPVKAMAMRQDLLDYREAILYYQTKIHQVQSLLAGWPTMEQERKDKEAKNKAGIARAEQGKEEAS